MSKTFNTGRYQVIGKLGAGGMAIVYKALDTVLSRPVTVKVLREQFTSDEDFIKRFRREAQAVASLSHPNIVSVYDVGKDAEQEYIVMEFVDGQNLKEYIKEHAPLPVEQAVDIAKQICDALDHAHKHQIIHRDIKPHNILLTADGRAKVTDFGIARAASAATVTHTGTIVGSVHYFSPEQARGEVTNEQSDLYSLGIILYEMVTGELPYDGESPISIALKHMNEQPTPPSVHNPSLPKNIEQVILRAINKSPEARYANAREFKQDLERIANGLDALPFAPGPRPTGDQVTQVMRPVGVAASLQGKKKRRLTPAGWAAVALIILAFLFGTSFAIKSFLSVKEVKMPNVVNMPQSQALATLQIYGLKVNPENIKLQPDDKVPKGNVISQNPPEGRSIRVNNPDIKLVVSSGPGEKKMPDLSQMNIDEAKKKLKADGITQDPTVNYEKSPTVQKDVVIKQDPAAGSNVQANATITLTVSAGPDTIKMPSVINLTKEDAVALLESFNLRNVTTEPKESDKPQGVVINSTPKAGKEIAQDTQITLIISAGPPQVPPKVITAEQMTNYLKEALKPYKDDNNQHQVTINILDKQNGLTQVDNFVYQAGTPVTPYQKDIPYVPPAQLQIVIDGTPVKNFNLQ